MNYKGITYDIGTEYTPNILTREDLKEDVIRSDMYAIKNKLNCNSVRIYGKESEILISVSEIALQHGLNVWISPRLIDGNIENTLTYLKNIATEFELLKLKYPMQELVLIIGGELTTDMNCFVQGNTIQERVANLLKPLFFLKNAFGIKPKYQKSFNQFLKNAVSLVKKEFSGKVTYASAMWEKVDWSDFDFTSMNLYKASFNKSFFNQTLKKLLSAGKSVIISEFGCCSYYGADKKGPTGYTVLDSTKTPPVFKEVCIRNEKVQADYIIDLLQTFDKEKVAGSFIFDFYSQKLTYSDNPDNDYDMASFSITKSLGNNNWEPKESFNRIADYYRDN
jgi:hypothetical protein